MLVKLLSGLAVLGLLTAGAAGTAYWLYPECCAEFFSCSSCQTGCSAQTSASDCCDPTSGCCPECCFPGSPCCDPPQACCADCCLKEAAPAAPQGCCESKGGATAVK